MCGGKVYLDIKDRTLFILIEGRRIHNKIKSKYILQFLVVVAFQPHYVVLIYFSSFIDAIIISTVVRVSRKSSISFYGKERKQELILNQSTQISRGNSTLALRPEN